MPLQQKLLSNLVKLVVGLSLVLNLLGGFTFYHFYFQPTGITSDVKKSYSRAELLDIVIGEYVAQHKAK